MDHNMGVAAHAGAPSLQPRGLSNKAAGLDADRASITSSGEALTALQAACSEAEMRFSRSPSIAGLQETSPAPAQALPAWSVEASAALYNVHGWGCGYFGVSPKGTVTVMPWAGALASAAGCAVLLGMVLGPAPAAGQSLAPAQEWDF